MQWVLNLKKKTRKENQMEKMLKKENQFENDEV